MESKKLDLREGHGFCTLPIKVIPRSSQNKVMGVKNGILKLKLTAPPIEGAANEAVINFLAEWFGRPKSSIELMKGEQSRNKLVRLIEIKAVAVLAAIEKINN